MSLEKAILHSKEHRKPYHDSRRFDWSCRNHKSCPYCERGRQYQILKEQERIEQEMKLYLGQYNQRRFGAIGE